MPSPDEKDLPCDRCTSQPPACWPRPPARRTDVRRWRDLPRTARHGHRHPGQLGLIGTEADDVVVTNGAVSVETLGGADLVCVTDNGYYTGSRVNTGAGNDVVDASGTRGRPRPSSAPAPTATSAHPRRPGSSPGRAATHSTPRSTRWSPPRVGAPPPRATRSSPITRCAQLRRHPADGPRQHGLLGRRDGRRRPARGRPGEHPDTPAGHGSRGGRRSSRHPSAEDGVTTLRWAGPFVRFNLYGSEGTPVVGLRGQRAGRGPLHVLRRRRRSPALRPRRRRRHPPVVRRQGRRRQRVRRRCRARTTSTCGVGNGWPSTSASGPGRRGPTRAGSRAGSRSGSAPTASTSAARSVPTTWSTTPAPRP